MFLMNSDTIMETIGIIGASILSISFIPHTIKIYHDIEHADIIFCLLMILCSVMMSSYSYYFNVIPMFIANISVLCNNILVLTMIICNRNKFLKIHSSNV
jgi:uncharacterized protein with PQ loop repeat